MLSTAGCVCADKKYQPQNIVADVIGGCPSAECVREIILLVVVAVALARAAPKMSPRLAPLSDEPKSAMACFSSAVSRALIDKVSLRVFVDIGHNSIDFFTNGKASARCSARSRLRSVRRIKPVMLSPTVTSMPLSLRWQRYRLRLHLYDRRLPDPHMDHRSVV